MSTAKSRARNYLPQITKAGVEVPNLPHVPATATNSAQALKAATNYLLSELRQLDDGRPEDADAARWHVAGQIGGIAALLPKRTRGDDS
jgi:hypothetical protein